MLKFSALRAVTVITGMIAAVGVLAGCGSSSPSSSTTATSGAATAAGGSTLVQDANAAVAKASATVSAFNGPKTSPPPAKNKTIYAIACSPDTEGCQRQPNAAIQAAKAMGWNAVKLDTDGSVQQFVSSMNQAIDAGANGIIATSFPEGVIRQPLARAAAKGIPVITITGGNTTPKIGPNFKGGLYADVDVNTRIQGQLAAQWVIKQTNGNAVLGVFTVPGFPEVQYRLDGFKSVFDKCKTCKMIAPVSVPVPSLAKDAAPAVAQLLQANPSISYFFSTFDGGAIFAAQGMRSAGKIVPMVAIDGNPPNIEMVRSGNIQAADLASPLEWLGWAAVDEMNRAFAGQQPAPEWLNTGSGLPAKLISKANAPPKGQPYTGDFDYQTAFKKLWGVK